MLQTAYLRGLNGYWDTGLILPEGPPPTPPKKRYFKRFNSYHIQLFKKTYFLAFHPISTPREILPFKKTAPQVERSVDTYVGNSSRVIIKESMTQC